MDPHHLLFYMLILLVSAHAEPFDSEASDLNRIKSMDLTFTETNETLEWPLELEDMAEYALQTKTFIKFDLNASHPVTFIMNVCGSDLIMSKTTPFKHSTLYLDGPWLEYFKNPSKNCKTPVDLTLEVYFGPTLTSGAIAFSLYSAFTPQNDPGNQTTSVPLSVTGTRKHMISMKDYLPRQGKSETTTSNSTGIYFLTNVPATIPFAISKCGLDAVENKIEPKKVFDMDTWYLERLIEFTHVYCEEKPYKHMLELSTTTPIDQLLPEGSALLITNVLPTDSTDATDPLDDQVLINVFIALFAILLVILIIAIAVTAYNCYKTKRGGANKGNEMAVFTTSKIVEENAELL